MSIVHPANRPNLILLCKPWKIIKIEIKGWPITKKTKHKVPDQWKLRSIIDKALATLATHEAIDPENIWLSQDDDYRI